VKYIRIYVYEYTKWIFASNLPDRDKKQEDKNDMAVMASDDPSPHPLSLRLDLAAHYLSRHHHAKSLLDPSFHDPRTPRGLKFDPERAAPPSRCDNEQQHAVGSHSTLSETM